MTGASLIRGDSIAIPLADESVDLIVTSPPYFALRSYQDGGEHYDGQIGSEPTPQAFLEALWAVTAECKRVLKPSGSMFVNLGDKYSGSGGHNNDFSKNGTGKSTLSGKGGRSLKGVHESTRRNAPNTYNRSSTFDGVPVPHKSLMLLPERYRIGAVDRLGLIARAVVIWDKPNGLPESVTDRVRRSHEDWVHLTKQPRYYAAVDEIREPQLMTGGEGSPNQRRLSGNGLKHREYTSNKADYNPLGKLPGSVWRIPSEPLQVPDHVGVDHYAAYPQEWPRRLILGWTPPGYCTECGQARTAVVEREFYGEYNAAEGEAQQAQAAMTGGTAKVTLGRTDQIRRTHTGYRCACPTPDAPTRPAVVLDPFSGTGTTCMVARALGRYGIGIDLSADYHRLATWRIWESGHSSKTNQRTWAERQGALL